jgi:hypothetical protein
MTKEEFLDYVNRHVQARVEEVMGQLDAGQFVVPIYRQRFHDQCWGHVEKAVKHAIDEMRNWPDGLFIDTVSQHYFTRKPGYENLDYTYLDITHLQRETMQVTLGSFFASMLGMTDDDLRRMVEAE